MPEQLEFDYDVFISYSSHDKEWVRGDLLRGIEKVGLRAFIDFRDFKRGAPSIKEIERGVTTCRKTLLGVDGVKPLFFGFFVVDCGYHGETIAVGIRRRCLPHHQSWQCARASFSVRAIGRDPSRFWLTLSIDTAGSVIAYCLMTHHYHLLIETPDAGLSHGMQLFNGVYTQWFNRSTRPSRTSSSRPLQGDPY